MYRLIYTYLLLFFAITISAQQFGTDWMTSPSSAHSSYQWFRRTFIAGNRPLRGSVSVATDSRFVLYVNGRNVSTALFMPIREENDSSPMSMTFDVTRFLRPDSNTVAVLLAPEAKRLATPRLSVGFFGSDATGSCFAYLSPDGWLCCPASTSVTTEGELMYERNNNLTPAYGDMAMAEWFPTVIQPFKGGMAPKDNGISSESVYGYNVRMYNPLADNAAYVHKILSPCGIEINGNSVVYDFTPGFYGYVRVTLRGCRQGERIRIGGLEYVCNGTIDEQAFCRFTAGYMRKVEISGDAWFRPEQVQEIYAVCM